MAVSAPIGQSLSVHATPVPLSPGPSPAAASDLVAALRRLRDVVAHAQFPLETPGAAAAQSAVQALGTQLDDYLIPRVSRMDAPVLAVVGGPTGAGKSTLVNSLIGAPISPSGVLRPTTRGPVLVCHPADAAWFGSRNLLPDLPRASDPGDGVLQVVAAPRLSQGLALLDAPDIDSVVARNRELADELLAAADLWLFVTTAARYADAVPWSVLRAARDRGTAVAVVLDRVPPAVRGEVTDDLGRLLSERGLPGAPLFAVAESTLDRHGLLPPEQVAPIEIYLGELAANEVRRGGVTRRTLRGAVATAAATADELAWVTLEQLNVADALTDAARTACRSAIATMEQQLRTGAVLRGAAYERWRESIASGELQRALRAARDPMRAKPAPAPPGRTLLAALGASLSALLVEAQTLADDEIAQHWRNEAAGRRLLREPTSADPAAARELVRDWLAFVQAEARQSAPAVRTRTRGTATAAIALLATVAAVAPFDAGGIDDLRATAAVTRLAEKARAELLVRIEQHLTAAAQVWRGRIAELSLDPAQVDRLRSAAAGVGVARQLTQGLGRVAA
jgi:hypothetical protein